MSGTSSPRSTPLSRRRCCINSCSKPKAIRLRCWCSRSRCPHNVCRVCPFPFPADGALAFGRDLHRLPRSLPLPCCWSSMAGPQHCLAPPCAALHCTARPCTASHDECEVLTRRAFWPTPPLWRGTAHPHRHERDVSPTTASQSCLRYDFADPSACPTAHPSDSSWAMRCHTLAADAAGSAFPPWKTPERRTEISKRRGWKGS